MALASFVVARLVAERMGISDEDQSQRAARCLAAKGWLGALTLPQPVRGAAGRCADLSVDGDAVSLAREVRGLILAASAYLDSKSRGELEALARSIEN